MKKLFYTNPETDVLRVDAEALMTLPDSSGGPGVGAPERRGVISYTPKK